MAAFFSRPMSAAVKIVAPPRPDGSPAPQAHQDPKGGAANQAKQLCSNLAKFGSCQFEGIGCIFYHPPLHERPQLPESRTASPIPPQAHQPSRQNVNAPVFVPKGNVSGFPRTIPTPPRDSYDHDPYDPVAYEQPSASNGELPPQLVQGLQNLQVPTTAYDNGSGSGSTLLSHPGPDSYYPNPAETFVRQPLNYHLYTPPSHLTTLTKPDAPNPQTAFFICDNLRQELTQRAEATRAVLPPSSSLTYNLPDELQGYHTLVPLDQPPGTLIGKERRPNFGAWHSSVYKATSSTDGHAYMLRRIENFRLPHESAFTAIEHWSRIRHPNIVSVREAFTTRAFNDNSLIVSYDYHPTATTLFDLHLKLSSNQRPHHTHHHTHVHNLSGQPTPAPSTAPSHTPIPEAVMWTYITQIGSAIRTVHSLHLAVRMIDATKILVTGKNRVRIGSCGIGDVVAYDVRQDVGFLQQEDLLQFGRLLLALCCTNLVAGNNLNKSLETVTRNYSPDIKAVILFLISKPVPHKSINQLFEMIGPRLLTEMEALQQQSDRLEGELTSELENGRVVRLLCKLGFINERPEFDREPRWSETGDRYIIKLFRDYVFHQVDENGSPVVNLSHVLTCLNKLDAGTEERIMLVSRDEQSCLVVSYKELKACIDSTFSDLSRGTSR